MDIAELIEPSSPSESLKRPKRTQRLSTHGKAKAAAVRDVGSCIRCHILKKSCDTQSPCALCQQENRKLFIPCVRRQLQQLDFIIKGFPLAIQQEEADDAATMTLLRQIDSDVALQLSVPTTAMLRYFIASYPYYKWARNALNFVFATKRYISGCLEYQELAARFQRIHMQEFALAYEKHLTLRDWWKLYNITAVLLGAWQQLVLANPLGTNAGETFRDAVEVLVGVFEYHTLRMQKVCKQQPIQVKAEAEKLDMRGHLVEIEEYAKDWSNDPFLPLLANVCRDFLQKILH